MPGYWQKINKAFESFGDRNVIPMASNAEWSMHQLLEFLLRKTGRAKVKLSSFSITEVAIRTFLNLKEEGLIERLDCLFDLTVKRHKAGLLFFTSNVADNIVVSKCHAKLILIETAEYAITVVGSPNFNINDKKEVVVVFFERWFFDFYSQVLDTWMEEGLRIDAHEFN